MESFERIRTVSNELSTQFYQKAAKIGKYIATAKPITEGRIELLHYVKEQSIAFEYHRYGSITDNLESSRRNGISSRFVLSHHRTYRSVYGGFLIYPRTEK
jgi:hypothetical protein